MQNLEERVRRLEDREQIRDLVVRYGFAVDERDLDGVTGLFAPDGTLRTRSGPSKGTGRDQVAAYFRSRFAVLGPTNHVTHGHLVDFDEADPDRATGLVASHAEVWRDGAPMITALRYHDTYRRVDGQWRFAERIQSYMYFVDVREYPQALGHPLRMRTAPDDWKPADWPEALAGSPAR